jgi:ubiquinone biosynthesis protein Coq4
MDLFSKIFNILRIVFGGIYYALKILIVPKDITSILKLGNLLTETRAFDHCLSLAKSDQGARQLIDERYTRGGIVVETIKQAPKGTLGAAVLEHMNKFKLDPYELFMASEVNERIYLRERQREIHDILHCVFNLSIEIKDEAKLNAIVMAQVYSPIATLIVAGSVIHTLFKSPEALPKLIDAIIDGVEIGRKSASIFSIKWEELMYQPLEVAQHALEIKSINQVPAITRLLTVPASKRLR